LGEEGHLADDQDVEDDPAGPNVSGLEVDWVLLAQIWTHVVSCAALYEQFLLLGTGGSEAKVYQLYQVIVALIN